MIKLLTDLSEVSLRNSHYSMLLKSHIRAYGTEYSFCEFYELSTKKKKLALFCCFNGSMVGDIYEGVEIPSSCKREISEFVAFKSPCGIELASELCTRRGFEGYEKQKRDFFEVKAGDNADGLNPTPDLEAVFKTAFTDADYGLWLTDTVRRKNRDILRVYSYNSSVLTLKIGENGHAYICDLATPESDRGKGYARSLLEKVAYQMKSEGCKCYLTALPKASEYYKHIGLNLLGDDVFYYKGDLK